MEPARADHEGRAAAQREAAACYLATLSEETREVLEGIAAGFEARADFYAAEARTIGDESLATRADEARHLAGLVRQGRRWR